MKLQTTFSLFSLVLLAAACGGGSASETSGLTITADTIAELAPHEQMVVDLCGYDHVAFDPSRGAIDFDRVSLTASGLPTIAMSEWAGVIAESKRSVPSERFEISSPQHCISELDEDYGRTSRAQLPGELGSICIVFSDGGMHCCTFTKTGGFCGWVSEA
jgi:hypothetical protein